MENFTEAYFNNLLRPNNTNNYKPLEKEALIKPAEFKNKELILFELPKDVL
jgi:hypothetical protein